MARSDLILTLVQSGLKGEQLLFRKSVEAVIAEEKAKQHSTLANRLSMLLAKSTQNDFLQTSTTETKKSEQYLDVIEPKKNFENLVFSIEVQQLANDLVKEHTRVDLLTSYGLTPRNKLLLIGPPGNGKTSFAEALANALNVDFCTVRYENLIGTYLGETASRIKQVFDFANQRRCVLFFDEFETLGKERGDTHETGEIKRVVSTLLMQLDRLSNHVVFIAATNHPELLDRAVWRRFHSMICIQNPEKENIKRWMELFLKATGLDLPKYTELVLPILKKLNFAEIEEFGKSVHRNFVLSLPNDKLQPIVRSVCDEWERRLANRGNIPKEQI
jgi:SpoVK/Ycf46/Vps4 family AAA+-type ATPase